MANSRGQCGGLQQAPDAPSSSAKRPAVLDFDQFHKVFSLLPWPWPSTTTQTTSWVIAFSGWNAAMTASTNSLTPMPASKRFGDIKIWAGGSPGCQLSISF
jgi:hypothetical protein